MFSCRQLHEVGRAVGRGYSWQDCLRVRAVDGTPFLAPLEKVAPFASTRPYVAALAVALLTMSGSAGAESPDPAWQGVERLAVHCRTNSLSLDQVRLCERVRTLAQEQTAIPVIVLPAGDPELLAPRTLALLADFAVAEGPGRPQLLFTLRLYRHGGEASLFGSRPRAAAIDGPSPALDAQLQAALSEILPRRGAPRPMGRL